jgi:hypothetical protein
MRPGGIGIALALAVAGVLALAGSGSSASIGLELSIAGPKEAEAGSWTDLRVALANTGRDSAPTHVTLTLPAGSARPADAEGATCSGSTVVECDVTIPAGGSLTLKLPIRWAGTGSQSVAAKARVQVGGSTSEVASSTTVTVYRIVLQGLKTTPSPARAGRSLTATATLARSDSGEALAARTVACPAAIGGLKLRGIGTLRGARVTCAWKLSAASRGSSVQASVLAGTHPGGVRAKAPFARRIS